MNYYADVMRLYPDIVESVIQALITFTKNHKINYSMAEYLLSTFVTDFKKKNLKMKYRRLLYHFLYKITIDIVEC